MPSAARGGLNPQSGTRTAVARWQSGTKRVMGVEPSVTTVVTATRKGEAPTAPACCLVTADTVAYALRAGKRGAARYFFSNTTTLLVA